MIKKIINKFKNRSADLKYFSWILRNGYSLKGFSLFSFLLFWILYPIPRLLYGETKASDISRNIIKRFMKGNLIVPLPLKNPSPYYMGINEIGAFDAFREVCINDHYNYSQLKPGMVCVDGGAHVGTFTLLASLRIGPEGKVIAVEPEAKNFAQLVKNLELNKVKNVIPKNIALSDFNGEEKFFIDRGAGCHSFLPQKSSIKEIKVEAKTLDNLLRELNIKKVDMFKIDTEGAELKILKGARETLLRNPQMKMVIASYHYPEEAAEVVKYLKELNFSPKTIPGAFTLVVV